MGSVLVTSSPVGVDRINVRQDFDSAIEKIYPLQAPSSSLEGRNQNIWILEDGSRAMIPPNIILRVEEIE